MPGISEVLNIYEMQIQGHYFKMKALFDTEVVPVSPEKNTNIISDIIKKA